MTGQPQQDQARLGGLRFLRRMVALLAVGVVLNTAGWVVGFLANKQSTDALCALRGDLERRVASSEKFLSEHPDGIPGIPAKTIRDGIANQQRTILVLNDLSCPK